ncbi:helix-turn-helix transcriptional regulator [Microbacterium oxydans]|jgi:transcriptional regulator with XRE-family HTH domain|uniref:helix-turn-helix transcriptional regulator n=1 Tax=Microbacterium TaxID=33882 RepID=UPI0025919995|nr:helix-turn-helix transcriptional regulator [uncultured Microbacterium sp.]
MSRGDRAGFGAVIREARRRQGWSQTELGEKAGVSRPTIARVEANKDVTTTTIAKIAQALDLTLELRDGS